MRDGERRTEFASESTPLVAPRVVQGDGGVSRVLFDGDEKTQLDHPSRLSREELNHLAGSFQEEDKANEKTWARRLVEDVLQYVSLCRCFTEAFSKSGAWLTQKNNLHYCIIHCFIHLFPGMQSIEIWLCCFHLETNLDLNINNSKNGIFPGKMWKERRRSRKLGHTMST